MFKSLVYFLKDFVEYHKMKIDQNNAIEYSIKKVNPNTYQRLEAIQVIDRNIKINQEIIEIAKIKSSVRWHKNKWHSLEESSADIIEILLRHKNRIEDLPPYVLGRP